MRQASRRWESTDTKLPMPKKKPSGFKTFARWTWRLIWIPAVGAVVYGFYGLHAMRNPNDQEPPDPSKKTLVVLGMTSTIPSLIGMKPQY
jgi:NADH:ubiquinone reductase (non-electrogenic)